MYQSILSILVIVILMLARSEGLFVQPSLHLRMCAESAGPGKVVIPKTTPTGTSFFLFLNVYIHVYGRRNVMLIIIFRADARAKSTPGKSWVKARAIGIGAVAGN